MKRVVIESPYAGDVAANVTYARRCLLDSLRRGEAPFASHLLYTQDGVLSDLLPEERSLGIAAGLAWGTVAQLAAVYLDRGVSEGMRQGILAHRKRGLPIVCRRIDVPDTLRLLDVDEDESLLCTCVQECACTDWEHQECDPWAVRTGCLLHDERLETRSLP